MRASLFLLVPAALVAHAQAPAPTADQLLAKYTEARGGMAKLKELQSVRITARAMMGPMEMPTVVEKNAKGFRSETTVQDQKIIQAFDGTHAWAINPMTGSDAPQEITGDAVKALQSQSDIAGPLVDSAAKGHKVEYLGREAVGTVQAHKLKVTLKSGGVVISFLDPESFLEIKQVTHVEAQGQSLDIESSFEDFRKVAGITVPFAIEQTIPGAPAPVRTVIDKVEFNVAVDAARFAMPAAKPATAPAAK
ncbi:MAG TPA: hypothetical protein VJ570_01720 [Holophagaceae bacterium]|nr:hypothetical protein [Holophagaceae bacterium]